MSRVLYLNPHARACVSGDWAVFLDIKRDRYFAIPSSRLRNSAGEALIAGAQFASFTAEAALADRLQAMELAGGLPPARDAPPARRAIRWRRFVYPPAFADLIYALVWAKRATRGGALARAVGALKAQRNGADGEAATDIDTLWRQFERSRVWFPAAYVCLLDSLALAMFAALRGARCDIVFGVRGRPFAAHCWVEHEGRIINDAAEYCSAFTPILRA